MMEEMQDKEILQEEQDLERERRKRKLKILEAVDMIVYCVGVLVVCFFIINFVGQRTIVVGDSMENTLYDGDNLIVDKVTYRFSDPKRYDIVVFPCKAKEDTLYIKRIIGLPGEKVQIDKEGNIYINDELLVENYGKEVMIYAGLAKDPIYLGADEYFVLGDNRNNSEDSRFSTVGVVDSSEIVGKAFFRLFPLSDFGIIDKE